MVLTSFRIPPVCGATRLREFAVFVVIDVGGAEDSLVVTAGATGFELVHVPAHQHAMVACLAQHAGQGGHGDRLGLESLPPRWSVGRSR